MIKDKNPNKGTKESSSQPVDSRIAAVRDLIFGENMVQYDQDFTEVSNQIAALKNDTDKNLASLASSLGESDKDLNNLSTTLENKIAALQRSTEVSIEKLSIDIHKKLDQLDDAKADRKKLGKALEKIALMLQG